MWGDPAMSLCAQTRADFPILNQEVRPGVALVYLDNAATTQKPVAVLDALDRYYRWNNANIHRGVHALAERATADYESARKKVARFIGAGSARQVVFVRNTTEAINLIAQSWGRANIGPGDEILLTELEHHSNIVPWQLLAREKGAAVRYLPVDTECRLDMSGLDSLLTERTRLVAFSGMSNVTGAFGPMGLIVERAHAAGAVVVLDGAQLVPHAPVNVAEMDVDFLAFSGHKMLGPTGIGVLYGKRRLLESMPPFQSGGDMIRRVTWEGAEWNDVPCKFEAGTPNIAGAIGLAAAVDYLEAIGMERIAAADRQMAAHLLEALGQNPGVKILGPIQSARGAVAAFTVDGVHPHDLAELLNREGIAIRAGHHCAMPLHHKLGLAASARASLYLYNKPVEIDLLVRSIRQAQKLFGVG
jgi:cysteine desulfurase/selenocysteine lyase